MTFQKFESESGHDTWMNRSVRIVNGYPAKERGFMVLLRLNDLVRLLIICLICSMAK